MHDHNILLAKKKTDDFSSWMEKAVPEPSPGRSGSLSGYNHQRKKKIGLLPKNTINRSGFSIPLTPYLGEV